jgi:ribosome biogenesis protein YTM1
MDRVIRVNRLSAAVEDEEAQRNASLAYLLPLHSQPVASVRSSPHSSTGLLSASWDGLVALWSLTAAYEGAADDDVDVASSARARKKRKTAGASNGHAGATRLAPVHVLQGHVGQVGRAIFDREDAKRAYSAGWDHSVRSWDLEVGGQTSTRVRSPPAHSENRSE